MLLSSITDCLHCLCCRVQGVLLRLLPENPTVIPTLQFFQTSKVIEEKHTKRAQCACNRACSVHLVSPFSKGKIKFPVSKPVDNDGINPCSGNIEPRPVILQMIFGEDMKARDEGNVISHRKHLLDLGRQCCPSGTDSSVVLGPIWNWAFFFRFQVIIPRVPYLGSTTNHRLAFFFQSWACKPWIPHLDYGGFTQ